MYRVLFFVISLTSFSSHGVLYDIFAKYNVRMNHQLQDIAWDDVSNQMFVFFEPEPLCDSESDKAAGLFHTAFLRPVDITTDSLEFFDTRCNPYSIELNAHQGYDIQGGQLYMHAMQADEGSNEKKRLADRVYIYDFDSSNNGVMNNIPKILNLTSIDDKEWLSKSLATDGNFLVVAGYISPNYFDVVIHIYKLDSDLVNGRVPLYKSFAIDDPSEGIQGKSSLDGGVQGLEVVNGKVYVSFGGLEKYGDQDNTQVRQYTFDGFQTGHVTLAPKGIMAITKDEYHFPSSTKIEHEGLTVKDGVVYSGVWYTSNAGHKHLLYEAFDSNATTGDGWIYLKNKQKGMCLNVYGVDGENGANVTLHPCVGSEDQIWYLPPVGTWGAIKNRVNNLCLNPEGTKGSKGANVNIATCNLSYDDQNWMQLTDGRIVNKAQGFCLNPAGTDGADRANIDITTCSGVYSDQKWDKTIGTNQVVLDEPNPNTGLDLYGRTSIKNKAGSTCLDASGYSGDLGSNVYMNNCDGLPDQMWELPPVGQWGYIKNVMNGACLNPSGTSGGKNANVNLGNCVSGYSDLLWKQLPDGKIINGVKGYCLNPIGTAGASGSNVNLYRCDSRYLDHFWY